MNNFRFLKEKWPILENLGKLAERNLYIDSNTTFIKCGMFGEIIVQYMFSMEKIDETLIAHDNNHNNRIKLLKKEDLIPEDIDNILHMLRIKRNSAAHQGYEDVEKAKVQLEASSEWIIVRNRLINPRYLMWCMKSKYFREYLLSNVSGVGGSLMRAQPKFVKEYPIPLSPLAEQQRIVEVIESLFEKLDTAKELVQSALDSFGNRKSAILHKAFTGELTAKWREENGVSLEEWKETTIGKICDCIVPGRDKPKSFTGSVPWITIPNLDGDYICKSSTTLLLTIDEINEVRAKIIPVNSVVMSCVGRFGISAIVTEECVINQQLHAFLPSDLINNRFLMYNIRYLKGYMEEKATSTTIAYLNKTACNSLPINLPNIEEQKEIVRILDNLLDNEQRAKELSDVIEKIDLMKKSILARAFRGELGTNNPEEESAVELLKEVLSEKI